MTDADRLSPHFTLDEMVRSQAALRLGLDNLPPPQAVTELRRLCVNLLEPARALLGVAFYTSSGFRCAALNAAIGGAVNSAHLYGRAADVIPQGLSLETAFDILRRSRLPYDQVIVECGAWLHLSIAPAGLAPRREAMTASGGPGHWVYTAVTA